MSTLAFLHMLHSRRHAARAPPRYTQDAQCMQNTVTVARCLLAPFAHAVIISSRSAARDVTGCGLQRIAPDGNQTETQIAFHMRSHVFRTILRRALPHAACVSSPLSHHSSPLASQPYPLSHIFSHLVFPVVPYHILSIIAPFSSLLLSSPLYPLFLMFLSSLTSALSSFLSHLSPLLSHSASISPHLLSDISSLVAHPSSLRSPRCSLLSALSYIPSHLA